MSQNKVDLSPAFFKQQLKAEEGNNEKQLSIVDIINMMITFWWLVALLAIIIGGGAYAFTKLTAIPQYSSVGTLYIDTQKKTDTDDVNASGLKAAAGLLPTYIEVLKSSPFLEEVANGVNNSYTPETISKMITYNAITDTNLLEINVKSSDSHDSYLIAKSIIRNAPTKISQVFEGGSVKVIDYPQEAYTAESDNAFKNGIIGFILGAALAVLIIFLINLFDTRIKNAEELTTKYGLPILGEIPNLLDM